jgi:hypothetical protein
VAHEHGFGKITRTEQPVCLHHGGIHKAFFALDHVAPQAVGIGQGSISLKIIPYHSPKKTDLPDVQKGISVQIVWLCYRNVQSEHVFLVQEGIQCMVKGMKPFDDIEIVLCGINGFENVFPAPSFKIEGGYERCFSLFYGR